VIDLRSDTVTRPTPAMRRVMAEAEVGDDVFEDDPTVRRLEEETAAVLGKEAALFVPSGTMSNAIAIYVSAGSGAEVWAHEHSHVMTHEQGGMAVLARAFPRPFTGPDAYPDRALMESRMLGLDDVHRAEPHLICVENTFAGRPAAVAHQRAVAEFAREHGLGLHLDGARLWNAAVALGIGPAEAADGADTVSVCFSKGLGAPVGSAVVGTARTVARARRARKLFGGGMRQVGVIAAGALHALRHHRARLAEDHERAERLGEGMAEIPGLDAEVRTNMVLVRTSGRTGAAWVEALAGHGVACVAMGENLLRFVVHLDITDADIDTALARLRDAAKDLA
jgi:threonine aldolase